MQSRKLHSIVPLSHRRIDNEIYRCKLIAPDSVRGLMSSVESYICDDKYDLPIWFLKHKEFVWWFTRYFHSDQLRSFFHPMTDEQVPFKSLVLTHYRKAEYTEKLAEMCGYGLHNFRKLFKQEFGVSPYKWLMMKKAEHIKYRLSKTHITFTDIIDEFNFSSNAHFTTFCKQHLGGTPSKLRLIFLENQEVESK